MKTQPTGFEMIDACSLEAHLLRECKAMARYALSSALKVPGPILQTLEACDRRLKNRTAERDAEADGAAVSGYAADTTDSAPPLAETDMAALASIHAQLADIVTPAKPRTLVMLIQEEKSGGFLHFMGPVPLIRRMMTTAIFCLVSLILISLSIYVNGDTRNFSLFYNHGIPLLLNELFLLCAAGIGASFSALFLASRYIQEGTYDSKYEGSYWSRFILGLMAGMILAGLFPIDSYIKGGQAQMLQGFGKPLLALLGGFSAALVYRLLNHVLTAIESLVRGDTRALVAAQEQATKARYAEQAATERLHLLAKLNGVQQQFQTRAEAPALIGELDRIQQELASPVPLDGAVAVEVRPLIAAGKKRNTCVKCASEKLPVGG